MTPEYTLNPASKNTRGHRRAHQGVSPPKPLCPDRYPAEDLLASDHVPAVEAVAEMVAHLQLQAAGQVQARPTCAPSSACCSTTLASAVVHPRGSLSIAFSPDVAHVP
jgi:hypothetical protein